MIQYVLASLFTRKQQLKTMKQATRKPTTPGDILLYEYLEPLDLKINELAELLQQMMSWWLNAPPQNNDITLPNTFSQSLYDVLMHQRNLAWRDKLRAMPPGRYVVAVGALHLYGEGNLPQMLR